MESRSRIVTAPSVTESKSTVTQNGVPISSWRRYRRPIACVSSNVDWNAGRTFAQTERASSLSSGFFESGRTATLYGARSWRRRRTTRTPYLSGSSSYAAQRNANVARSAPTAVSTTYGTNRSFVASSKYSSFFPEYSA